MDFFFQPISAICSLCRLSRNRLFHVFLVLLSAVLLIPVSSPAQFKFRKAPNQQDPGVLNPFQEKLLWNDFLQARSVGRFVLNGSLRYRPAGSASRSYQFTLQGNWNSIEHYSRLQLTGKNGVVTEHEIIIRDSRAFRMEIVDGCKREVEIDTAGLSTPLIESLPFTWNDILMPYLAWPNVSYIGPDRYLGRPAHQYIVTTNDSDSPIANVRITLDEDYAVLLKSDVLDKDDNVIKRIRVRGFKQFGNEWMFSELVWEHRLTRESVLLEVTGFELDPQ